MAILTGSGLVDFAVSKKGTPYVYGAKLSDGPLTQAKVDFLARNYPGTVNKAYLDKIKKKGLIGKVCVDCSGLIAGYTGKNIGSSQLYSTAKTRMAYVNYRDFAPGTVLWRSGHVGVFTGLGADGKYHCMEAKGIDYGTVDSIITPSSTWKYGLTFDYMDYTYDKKLTNTKPKQTNPYTQPTSILKKGAKGEGVKWIQTELVEAGYGGTFTYNGKRYSGVKVDGDFGTITDAATRAFQASSKLEVDGEVGKATRNALIAN